MVSSIRSTVDFVEVLDGGDQTISSVKALRSSISFKDLTFQPILAGEIYSNWHLIKSEISNKTPKINDKVVEGSDTWVVRNVENLCFGQRFLCLCQLAR